MVGIDSACVSVGEDLVGIVVVVLLLRSCPVEIRTNWLGNSRPEEGGLVVHDHGGTVDCLVIHNNCCGDSRHQSQIVKLKSLVCAQRKVG